MTMVQLASCPWGLVPANGVDLLSKIYVIFMSVGPTAVAGDAVTDGRKARKYIRIFYILLINGSVDRLPLAKQSKARKEF